MKKFILFLSSFVGLVVSASGQQVPIYSDDFSGGATGLNGTAPDIRPGSETWLANDNTFLANGTVDGLSGGSASQSNSAWLPFVPQAGNLYLLSAEIDTTSSDWISLGFVGGGPNADQPWYNASNAPYHGVFFVNNAGVGGFRPGDGSGNEQSFTGLSNGPVTVEITLDASDPVAANWTIAFSAIDQLGNTASSSALSANSGSSFGNILSVGFSNNSIGSGSIDDFELSIVPEPSAAAIALGGVIFVFAVARRRRKS